MSTYGLNPLRRVIFRAFLLVLVCFIGAFPTAARAQNTPLVFVNPETLQVGMQNPSEMTIEVQDVEKLYGFDLNLTFDPDVMEIEDAFPGQEGIQVSQGVFLDAGYIAVNEVNNEQGTLRFVMTQLNPSEPKTGSGVLLVIKVKGKQSGSTSAVSLSSVVLASQDGLSISAASRDGSVSVVEGAPSTKSAASTPVPVQNPTAIIFQPTPDGFVPTLPAAAAPQPTSEPQAAPEGNSTAAPQPDKATPAAAAQQKTPKKIPTKTRQPAYNGSQQSAGSAVAIGAIALAGAGILGGMFILIVVLFIVWWRSRRR